VRWRIAFFLSTATWSTGLEASAEDIPSASQRLELTFPVSVNGRLSGNVLADIDMGSEPNVDTGQLFSLLTETMDQAVLAEMSARLSAERRVSISELQSAGLDIAYNAQALRLDVRASEAQTRQQILSLSSARRADPSEFTPPSRAAAGITASLLAEYRHDSPFVDEGLQPLEGIAQGFLNVGGFEGLTLDFDMRVDREGTLVRNSVVLTKDDFDAGTRLAAGDIDPLVTGFQSSPSLGGISYSRQFGTIQPFRDVRPTGQQGLFLERDAIVDIVIDGVIVRTLSLSAGRYEIRDFPFIDASADVEFYVDDGSGRQQVGRLSLFGADNLLEPGLSVFSANLGFLSKSRTPDENYDGNLAFTGFYERGLTPNLTLGANLQATHRDATLGVRAAGTSRLGRLSVDLAGSTTEVTGAQVSGYAYSANYRSLFDISANTRASFELVANRYTEHFSTLSDGFDIQPRKWDAAARASIQLPAATSLTVGSRISEGRGLVPDERLYDVSLSKLFGRINTFTSVGYDGVTGEMTGRIGLSLRWGDRLAARSGYNSRTDVFNIEAERLPRLQAGDLSGRIGYEQRSAADFFSGDVLYRGNRVEGSLRHTYTLDDRPGYPTEQISAARLSTGLGVTPSGWAFGRRADEGFAIVEAHKSLKGRKIDLEAGYSRGPIAQIDRWGAVAVPLLQPYVPQTIKVEVRDLPLGYDIGAGKFEVLPGSGSGYNFTVGSAASYTVVGILATEGRDLYLTSGTLTSLETGEATAFFTNRAGRFVVERVAPGDYVLRINGVEAAASISVLESEVTYVDVGNIVLR
jgi:outer membrane usher protein